MRCLPRLSPEFDSKSSNVRANLSKHVKVCRSIAVAKNRVKRASNGHEENLGCACSLRATELVILHRSLQNSSDQWVLPSFFHLKCVGEFPFGNDRFGPRLSA